MGIEAIIAGAAGAIGSGIVGWGLLDFAWKAAENKPAVKQIMRENGLGSLADRLPG
ncbi:hypothetical protein [Dietzia sp. 179-F 9C3 NHS]|uniref:hypothetical protein n=1 Tax=Dietzia sp. 179-F 9C3 NHS TaxID=3374295 RepID=UPI00387A78C7